MALASFITSCTLALISSMARESAPICWLASWMLWAISPVLARVMRVLSVTLSRRSFTLDTSQTKAAVDWFCSREAWCSCTDCPFISSDISARRSAAALNPPMVSFMDRIICSRLPLISTKSPLYPSLGATFRFPSATWDRTSWMSDIYSLKLFVVSVKVRASTSSSSPV